jgi:hypothetical protein
MNRLLPIVALLGLTGLGFAQTPAQTPSAQSTDSSQSPATQTPPTPTDSSAMPQQETDATSSQQSARSFEGKIEKLGDKLVLEENATQTSYQLDDQGKAKQFRGKKVKVMATLDPSTNQLHVVDISPSPENR